MEEKIEGDIPDKFLKLLDLLDDDEYYINDFLACVCCVLCNLPHDRYETGIKVGGNFFDISITKRRLQ